MMRYLIPILVMSVLASALIVGCPNPERDEALKFYRGLYPIVEEIEAMTDEWTSWAAKASQVEYEQNIFRKSHQYEVKLVALYKDLSMLYAPPRLRQLKDYTGSAINKATEAFRLSQMYVSTGNTRYWNEANSALLEFNRLMSLVADEWDDGLAHYKIKSSEIMQTK